MKREDLIYMRVSGHTPFSLFSKDGDVALFDYYKMFAEATIAHLNSNCNQYNNYKESIAFKFSYKNDFSINASAGHKSNIDYVFVNEGTIFRVYKFFYTQLANPNVFPQFGEDRFKIAQINLNYTYDGNNSVTIR